MALMPSGAFFICLPILVVARPDCLFIYPVMEKGSLCDDLPLYFRLIVRKIPNCTYSRDPSSTILFSYGSAINKDLNDQIQRG